MNTLSGARTMRIIALPLVMLKNPRDIKIKRFPDTTTMSVFYHFDLVSPFCGHKDPSWNKRVLKSMTDKAAELWTSLGKAPKGSWKLWTYQLGERIIDKTEFEELALNNVDPSLGPTVPLARTSERADCLKGQPCSLPKISLIYPPSLYPSYSAAEINHALSPPLAHLQAFLTGREPRHRIGFYIWMLTTPLTFPISLIPLIPNLPLFFCVWRSWSHYRAYRSSQYLSSLLKHGQIEPNPSLELDKLYSSPSPPLGTSQNILHALASSSSENKSTIGNVAASQDSSAGAARSEHILLTREAVPCILDLFRLPETTSVNLYRAISQARRRLGETS